VRLGGEAATETRERKRVGEEERVRLGEERVRLGGEAATETRGKEWVGEMETWRGGSN
jgi:hypothetical protein